MTTLRDVSTWRWFLCTLLLLSLSTIRGQEEGRIVRVEWKADAVRNHTPESPLQVYPGDTLIFQCPNGSYSNVWYQLDVAQYSNCNCTTGSFCKKIGECNGFSPRTLIQEISANSATIGAAAVYEAGRKYFFTSYSFGGFQGALSNNRWGGECSSEELRMVIEVVGEATTSPTAGSPALTSAPSSATGGSGNTGNTGNMGNTGNTGNTGDNGNTGGGIDNSGDTGDTGNTGDITDGVQTTPDGTGSTGSTAGNGINVIIAGVSGGSTMNSCSRFIMYSSVVLCACLAVLLRP